MEQLILHLIGDYLTQSHWMAQNKTKAAWPAMIHAGLYSLPFLLLTGLSLRGQAAWAVILSTHFFIDRYGLARYLVWVKNWLGARQHFLLADDAADDRMPTLAVDGHLPQRHCWAGYRAMPPWGFCKATGYPPDCPAWLAVWLLIIADNSLHLAINYAALRWL